MNWRSDSTFAHELGGVPSWALTKELFNRARETLVVGSRPVPQASAGKGASGHSPADRSTEGAGDLLAATRSLYDSTGTALMSQRWKQEGKA